MDIISIQQLAKDRQEYTHQFKWSKQAIDFNDAEQLQKLAKEIDILASDNTKNEKIGFQFRSFALNDDGTLFLNDKGEMVIDDISVYMERYADGNLLSGNNLLEFAKEYKDYTKSLNRNLKPEVIYCYYALDLKNQKHEPHEVETISEHVIPLKNNNKFKK